MDRFSDSSRECWKRTWVKTPGTGRVNVELGIVIICFMEDSSITGAIDPYRLSSWLLSTFPTPFLLVILTPTVNYFKWKAQHWCRERKHSASPPRFVVCTFLCTKLNVCPLPVWAVPWFSPLSALWLLLSSHSVMQTDVPVSVPRQLRTPVVNTLKKRLSGEHSPLHAVVRVSSRDAYIKWLVSYVLQGNFPSIALSSSPTALGLKYFHSLLLICLKTFRRRGGKTLEKWLSVMLHSPAASGLCFRLLPPFQRASQPNTESTPALGWMLLALFGDEMAWSWFEEQQEKPSNVSSQFGCGRTG